MQSIRALQTPLQEVTVGSGERESTQTWPTQPSLLHTHTSCEPNVGAAHVNCRPARVLRIGTGAMNSGHSLLSTDNANMGQTIVQVKYKQILPGWFILNPFANKRLIESKVGQEKSSVVISQCNFKCSVVISTTSQINPSVVKGERSLIKEYRQVCPTKKFPGHFLKKQALLRLWLAESGTAEA